MIRIIKNYPLILVLIFAVLVSTAITFLSEKSNSNLTVLNLCQQRHGEAISRANQYITKQVGENYFKQNYILHLEKSALPKDCVHSNIYSYSIAYEYLPLTRITDRELVVYVMPGDENVISRGYIAHIENGKVREPMISKAEALRIANQNKLDTAKDVSIYLRASEIFSEKEKGFFWDISIPIKDGRWGSECGESHIASVDAVTGSYQYKGKSVWCF